LAQVQAVSSSQNRVGETFDAGQRSAQFMADGADELGLSLLHRVCLNDIDDCQGAFGFSVFGFDWNVAYWQIEIAVFADDSMGVRREWIRIALVLTATTTSVSHRMRGVMTFDIFVNYRFELAPDDFAFRSTEQLYEGWIAGSDYAFCVADNHAVCGMLHEATEYVFRLCA
jgi:hypothetical protein